MALTEEERDLLRRALRGGVQSLPFLGALLEQAIFASEDDKAQREFRRLVEDAAREQRETASDVRELLELARAQIRLTAEGSERLTQALATATEAQSAPAAKPVPAVFISSTIDEW